MIAALIVVCWLIVIGLVLALFAGGAPRSECSGNCDQGRRCTCAAEG